MSDKEPTMGERRPLIVGKYPKTPGEANRALDADTLEPQTDRGIER